MRKFIKLFLLVLIIACVVMLGTVSATEFSAVADNNIRIVKSATASDLEVNAAGVLQKYLSEILGYDVIVVTDAEEAAANEIVIGATDRRVTYLSEVEQNGYVIQSDNGSVYIVGKDGGTLYGAYAFLQDFCDCRWYTSTTVVIPENAAFALPTNADILYNPYFEYKETDWLYPNTAEYHEFSVANGLNGGNYRYLSDAEGGTVNYIGAPFAHTLTNNFCKVSKYYDSHPEYFALVDGVRLPTQLCLSNETVRSIIKSEVLDVLHASHDPSAALQIISLTQHDNQKYCTCDNCKALAAQYGDTQSGIMIDFVNEIADYVAALDENEDDVPDYANVAIDTFAYQYTRKAPENITPRANVIVRLCTIEGCFCHDLNDPDCEENAAVMADLADWSKICNRIYIWDYTTNYRCTTGLFPDFGVLQDNMQTFYENNVLGIYEEGNYYMSVCNTEFGDLRAYLIAKLFQNPYCDYYAEMDGFLKAFYGDGWQNIRKFLDKTTSNIEENGQDLYLYYQMIQTLDFTDEDVAYCDGLWEAAKSACKDEGQLQNIKRSELSWRIWKASNFVGEFSGIFSQTRIDNNKVLYADMLAAGVALYGEGRPFNVTKDFYYLLPPDWWLGDINPITYWNDIDVKAEVSAVAITMSVVFVTALFA